MELPPQSTSLSKIGLCLLCFAFIFHVVGFSSTYWLTTTLEIPILGTNNVRTGLFEGCSTFTPCESSDNPRDWQVGAAVVECGGLVLTIASIAGALLYVLVLKTTWVSKLRIAFIATGITAGALIISGAIVVSSNKDDVGDQFAGITFDIGWSFALAVVGGVLALVASIIFILDIFL